MHQGANLIVNKIGQLLTLKGAVANEGRQPKKEHLGVILDAAMVIRNGTVAWTGRENQLSHCGIPFDQTFQRISAEGKVIAPALIDAHTHTLFAGSRHREFAQYLSGKSYRDIAAEGGGILSTVRAVRNASVDHLIELTLPRLHQAMQYGIATLEIKSGYGLNVNDELKMLRTIQKLQAHTPIHLVPTLLAAHAIAPEYEKNPDRYVEIICKELIPAVARDSLAQFCDIFVEKNYFTLHHAKKIFDAALSAGLQLKLHGEQLSHSGSARLVSRYPLISFDHGEYLESSDIAILAESETTVVLIPGATLTLRLPPPAARALIDAGVRVAVATDFNPGSSPTQHLPLMLSLAGLLFQMSVPELFVAATYNGARALSRHGDEGSLTVGKCANFIVLDCESWEEFFYLLGPSRVRQLFIRGEKCYSSG